MFYELTILVSEFYKCDCQDIFFDVLSTELNLEGVVYFYQNSMPLIVQAIEDHFASVETSLKEACATQDKIETSISNVLKKKYQSNWRQINAKVFSKKYCNSLMQKI